MTRCLVCLFSIVGASLLPAETKLAPKPKRDLSYNSEHVSAQTHEAQRQSFHLAEGFELELVASEETGLPKPVMATFDDAGRLWSVTATMYPADKDEAIWQQPGKDRIVVC